MPFPSFLRKLLQWLRPQNFHLLCGLTPHNMESSTSLAGVESLRGVTSGHSQTYSKKARVFSRNRRKFPPNLLEPKTHSMISRSNTCSNGTLQAHSRPRGSVGMASLLCRWQTAGGGSIPCWSASKIQVQKHRAWEHKWPDSEKTSGNLPQYDV